MKAMCLQSLLIFVCFTSLQAKMRYLSTPVFGEFTILFEVERVNGLLEGEVRNIRFNASGACRQTTDLLAVSSNEKIAKVVG